MFCLKEVRVGHGEACTPMPGLGSGWDEGGILHVCDAADLFCTNGVCAKLQGVGGRCDDPSYICNSFAGLHCDVPSGTCAEP